MFDFAEFWEDIKRNSKDVLTLDAVRAQVAKLRRTGVEFDKVYTRLQSYQQIAAKDPTKYASYYRTLQKGDAVRAQIRKAVESVQSIGAWLKDNFNVSLGDLGAIPLIPIAVVGGIIVATNIALSWIPEAMREMSIMDAVRAAISGGDPKLAASILEKAGKKDTTSGNIADMAMWLAIGAVAIFVLPKLLGRRT